MNEKIDEIDNLIAHGVVESRVPEEMENESTNFRTPEELKAIEEAKRSKVVEAIQASTVYNNLANIPGVNTKELLVTMVDMYMELDSKALGNPEYIDLESLNIIINAVKEFEIDSVNNGIITNEDGTINKLESAKQLSDMSGVPVEKILAHNKVGALTSDVKIFQNDIAKSEKVFEALANVYGEKNNNDKYAIAQNKYTEFIKYNETLEKYSSNDENKRQEEKKTMISKKSESQLLGYIHAYQKGIATENQLITILEKYKNEKNDTELLKKIYNDYEKNGLNGLGNVKEEFLEEYNKGKNKRDLATYLTKGKLNFNKLITTKKMDILGDVYIAFDSGDKERIELAKDVLRSIKKDGKNIVTEQELGEIDQEQLLELMNKNLTTTGKKVYTKDSDGLKNLINRRKVNDSNLIEKLNRIEENIEQKEKNGIDSDIDINDALETSNDKKEMLEALSLNVNKNSCMRKNVLEYLEKQDVKSKDCANALAIEGLYLKLCEEEYVLRNGKYPETLEEKKDAYKNVYSNSNAGLVQEYMKSHAGIYGNFLENVDQMKINQIESMLNDNKLKNRRGNISVNELYENLEYTKNKGIHEDYEVSYNKAIINECSDILREYEQNIKENKTEQDLEKIEKTKKMIKDSLKKLPARSVISQSTINILTKGLTENTKIEFLDYMHEIAEEKIKEEEQPKKENILERFKGKREAKEFSERRKNVISDVLAGKKGIVPRDKMLKITAKLNPEDIKKEILEARENCRRELAPESTITQTQMNNESKEQFVMKQTQQSKVQEQIQDLVNPKQNTVGKLNENKVFNFLKNAFDKAGSVGEKIVDGSQKAFENIGKFANRLGDRIQGTGDFAPGMRESKKTGKNKSDKVASIPPKNDEGTKKTEQKESDTIQKVSDGYKMPENKMDTLVIDLKPEQMNAKWLENHGKETQNNSVLKTTSKNDRTTDDTTFGSDDEQK